MVATRRQALAPPIRPAGRPPNRRMIQPAAPQPQPVPIVAPAPIMMHTDIKAATFVFEHETLTPIEGQPDHNSIALLKTELFANAYGNECVLGGSFGYMGLIMNNAAYAEQQQLIGDPEEPFILPPAPDDNANPNDVRAHKQLAANLRSMEQHLKQQLLLAVDKTYIAPLRQPLTGFAPVTTKTILQFLSDEFDRIEFEDLQANLAKLDEPWDFNEKLYLLWDRIDKCQQFAKDANAPISDLTAMQPTFVVLQNTGVFDTHTILWKQRPIGTWTMLEFRRFFNDADRDRGLHTAKKAGFHGANNAKVSKHRTKTPAKANMGTDKTDTAATNNTDERYFMFGDKKIWYCWTHGGSVNPQHTSATCKRPASGHQKHATWSNLCGGCTDMNWSKQNRTYKRNDTATANSTANTTEIKNDE